MHAVEHKLRFVLGSSTLRLIKIEEKAEAAAIIEFNNKFCESRRVTSFCAEVSETTTAPLFAVPLSPDSNIHKVLFCDIAVGNSVFVSNRYSQQLEPPTGADSFIVRNSDATGYLSDSPQDIRNFSYVIKDKSRVLPLYEVTFEYDEEFERKSRGRVVCNRCTEDDAVVFCPSERANFCATCDEKVHNDVFLQRHERKYFKDVGQKRFFCCTSHPTRTVEYFCIDCKSPLCTDCKITGSHSQGEPSKHIISPFVEACRSAVKYVSDTKPRVEDALTKIGTELSNYISGLSSFKSGISAIKRQLEKEFKMLMQQLDNIESHERQVINARLVTWYFRRQNLKQMIEYPEILDPADLLISLKNIEEQRACDNKLLGDGWKFDHKKPEIHGRITLRVPGNSAERDEVPLQNTQAVDWRVKTMHISGEPAMSLD